MTTFENLDQLRSAVGTHLGCSGWHTVDQAQINAFADATGDHQWIHVDPERAKAGPFGTTIAHGYLTLSLAPVLTGEILTVNGISMGVNYGTNKVRFPSPVRVDSRVRAGAELASVEEVPGGVQVVVRLTYEVEGQEKPACVAETVARFYA